MPELSRRRMLRGTGAVLTGTGVGAVALYSTTNDAEAAEVSLSIDGDELTVRENRIEAIMLSVTVDWSYDVPSDESPKELVLTLRAGRSEDDMETIGTAESQQLFLTASEAESFEVDLLEQGVLESDALVPTEGGETTSTEVHVGVDMEVFDDNELAVASDSQTTTTEIDIERSDYDPSEYGTLEGSGELTVELE